jgi:glutamine amidotransferase
MTYSSSNPAEVRAASKLILPGVGAFGDGMRNLKGLASQNPSSSGTPALGICLGMHLLFTESEEFGHHLD